jgi:hypothetical protein
VRAALLLAVTACQPIPDPDGALAAWCDDEPPAEGELVVAPLCDDAELSAGEGQSDDWIIANAWVRVVVRNPLAALTLAGAGGGTVIDAAPWGWQDRLHELAPLVGGGWLDVDTFEVQADGFVVEGRVVSLPDRPAEAEGERRSIRWSLTPDSPWIGLEGADGAWLHPSGAFAARGEALAHTSLTWGHDGQIADDLGGAVRIDGVSALLPAPTRDATAWLYPDGPEVGGVAPGAEVLYLLAGDVIVGEIKVEEDGLFQGNAPPGADGMRAEALGVAPSAVVPLGVDVTLPVGAGGMVVLPTRWVDAVPRPFRVAWTDDRGRAGESWLPSTGGGVSLGEGSYTLELRAGPSTRRVTAQVDVPADETVSVDVTFSGFDPGPRVLARLAAPVDRSRTWRGGLDADALRGHMLDGAAFVVAAPEDDVPAAAPYEDDLPWIAARDGTTFTGSGFSIVSWPWSADDDESGHGVIPPNLVKDPSDALAAVRGGASTNRYTLVDQAWLDLAGPAWAIDPRPTGVLLDAPVDGPESWRAWFDALDAAVPITPAGPYIWADVLDPALLTPVEVEVAYTYGNVVATTGPLVLLDAGGYGPGSSLPNDLTAMRVRVVVHDLDEQLDNIAIISESGEVRARGDMVGARGQLEAIVASPGRWMVAAAWSDDGAAWAVTGPVWSGPPAVQEK